MTFEEMERAIQLVVDQQARFGARMDQLAVSMQDLRNEHAESYRRLSDAVITLIGQVGKVSAAQERLAAAQERLAAAQEKTEATVAELGERANAFITVVERYISEGRNGKH